MAGAARPPATAARRSWRSAGLPLPRGPRPRPPRCRSTSARRSRPARRRRPRHRPRPRPVRARASPSAALRHSHSLNVGSFHEPSERVALDPGRAAAGRDLPRPARRPHRQLPRRPRDLIERFFPGHYELVEPGADPRRAVAGATRRAARRGRPTRIAFCLDEERGALRLFLRALRRLDPTATGRPRSGCPTRAEVRGSRPELRERVRVDRPARDCAGGADRRRRRRRRRVRRPAPGPRLCAPALACRAPSPSCSQLAALRRSSPRDGELGLLFQPGDAITLAGQLERLLASPALRARARGAPRGAAPPGLGRGRRPGRGDLRSGSPPAATTRAATRRSAASVSPPASRSTSTCTCTPTTPPTARRRSRCCSRRRGTAGLGAIAITDHNEVSGAFAAPEIAEEIGDQGDRRRGGQDRRAGRGDRALPRREDRARDDDGRDDRRDPPPGRARLRAAPVRPPALGARLRAPARHGRGDRHPRGLQPAGRADRVQRGGRALRRQVPDRPGRRLGQPRRPGPRQRDDPRPRLRRARGVPRGDARRRHRPQAAQPGLRAGAEVAADGRRARRPARPPSRAGKR